MLIILQNSLADLRDFLPNTFRIKKPNWQGLNLDKDYINRFGKITNRSDHRKDWTNDDLYCKASRGFKFDRESVEALSQKQHGMMIYDRRLYPMEIREIGKDKNGGEIYYNHNTICNFQVGFIHANKKKLLKNPLTSAKLDECIRDCLNLPIDINISTKGVVRDRLYNINSYLGKVYLHATTEKTSHEKVEQWWVSSGSPMLIVEYSTSEMVETPRNTCMIKDLKEEKIRLFFKAVKITKNITIRTWFVETTKHTNPAKTRLLLDGLLHINSAQQCLNQVIKHEDKLGFLSSNEYKSHNTAFQRYLEFTFSSLFQRTRFGFPCKEFAQLLQECEDHISKIQRQLSISKFHELGIRNNYLRNLEEFIQMTQGETKSVVHEVDDINIQRGNERMVNEVDILLLTAVMDEFDVIYKLEKDWAKKEDHRGFYYYTREIENKEGKKITIALARPVSMGGEQSTNTATRLSTLLNPSCLSMVGICAGWRGKVKLGDVIVAESVFKYDDGKLTRLAEGDLTDETQVFSDIRTYNLDPRWKQRAEDMPTEWRTHIKRKRPLEHCHQEDWLLNAIYEFDKENGIHPTLHPKRKTFCPDYTQVIDNLSKKGMVDLQSYNLTQEGENRVIIYRNLHPDGPPKIDKKSSVYVKPIATGGKVVEDRTIFKKISSKVRSVLGVEMEGSAIGAVATNEQIQNFIVVKAVSDYADEEKADYFRKYAIEAAYRYWLAFIKDNYNKKI